LQHFDSCLNPFLCSTKKKHPHPPLLLPHHPSFHQFISVLHLYESLGWHRAGLELRKVHFAEEINEFMHLSIMEALGGDQLWIDRFIAQVRDLNAYMMRGAA
jgi:hypothetical protein